MSKRPGSTTRVQLQRYEQDQVTHPHDWVATEEPLEIRLLHPTSNGIETNSVSITMRTPGHDFELAAGFLFSESILNQPKDLDTMAYCIEEEQLYNIVNAQLRPGVIFDPEKLQRHFYTTSSCGVCGKASLEALEVDGCHALPDGPQVSVEILQQLPNQLREAQSLFERTGGLHAAGIFNLDGTLNYLREDVGRHNAVDKVIGHALMKNKLPLNHSILMLSGRASFELMQKALRAQIPIVAAVGAPSSLAIEIANNFNITLLGFVSESRLNVYSGPGRIQS